VVGVSKFAWDHNAFYQGLLIRQLPRECRRVLDVGCGAGAFAAELGRRVDQVDALDRSPAMIDLAKRRVFFALRRCARTPPGLLAVLPAVAQAGH
jgi:SAM-dependent methyltransferase